MGKAKRRKDAIRVFKKRVKLFMAVTTRPEQVDYKLFHLKTSATPCSCWLCRGEKYTRKQKHKPDLE